MLLTKGNRGIPVTLKVRHLTVELTLKNIHLKLHLHCLYFPASWPETTVFIISKIQLVVYYQLCSLIG